MAPKKQAVMVRIPGIKNMDSEQALHLAEMIKLTLDSQFPDKEVVVLIHNEDIHFMTESNIRDMIDTMENIIK